MVFSPSLLIMTPEPDFSMPFNVNAITHMIFGIFFVNTIFILFNDPKEAEDEKSKEQHDKSIKSRYEFDAGTNLNSNTIKIIIKNRKQHAEDIVA